MNILGDTLLVVAGSLGGLVIAAHYAFGRRIAREDLKAEQDRNETLRKDRDSWRDEALRQREVLDGKPPYFPRPLSKG